MLDEIKIMQFADGTLDPSERDNIQKEIENNPKYKKILDDYVYTAEILSNISKEIKSKPLPEYLNSKIYEFNRNRIKSTANDKQAFNFFNIFNLKYSAVAASFCIVFMAGYFVNQVILDMNSNHQVSIKFNDTYKNFRNSSGSESKILNFYESFNERKFNEEINLIANQLKKDQKFEILISEDKKAKFQYTESFKDKNNNECKILKSDKKTKLTSDGNENIFSLTICQNKNYWSLTSINIL
jgi:hypothetical protein